MEIISPLGELLMAASAIASLMFMLMIFAVGAGQLMSALFDE